MEKKETASQEPKQIRSAPDVEAYYQSCSNPNTQALLRSNGFGNIDEYRRAIVNGEIDLGEVSKINEKIKNPQNIITREDFANSLAHPGEVSDRVDMKRERKQQEIEWRLPSDNERSYVDSVSPLPNGDLLIAVYTTTTNFSFRIAIREEDGNYLRIKDTYINSKGSYRVNNRGDVFTFNSDFSEGIKVWRKNNHGEYEVNQELLNNNSATEMEGDILDISDNGDIYVFASNNQIMIWRIGEDGKYVENPEIVRSGGIKRDLTSYKVLTNGDIITGRLELKYFKKVGSGFVDTGIIGSLDKRGMIDNFKLLSTDEIVYWNIDGIIKMLEKDSSNKWREKSIKDKENMFFICPRVIPLSRNRIVCERAVRDSSSLGYSDDLLLFERDKNDGFEETKELIGGHDDIRDTKILPDGTIITTTTYNKISVWK